MINTCIPSAVAVSLAICFVSGLRIDGTSLVLLGDSLWLNCSDDRGGSPHSVSWYKDNVQFYWYERGLEPASRSFDVPGVHVDVSSLKSRKPSGPRDSGPFCSTRARTRVSCICCVPMAAREVSTAADLALEPAVVAAHAQLAVRVVGEGLADGTNRCPGGGVSASLHTGAAADRSGQARGATLDRTRPGAPKKHIQNDKKKRNAEGVLTKDFMVQGTLDFHKNAASLSLRENVTRAETLFALSMVANSLPYTWADVATLTYPHMFPDSQIAKGFQCCRKKISYIISDGLGPYSKEKVVQELVQPEVFYSIMIDETPVPEAKVQQLDVLARYYSVNTQNVVVEQLQSFHLGHATADELFCCVEDALNELPKKNMVCFFSDGTHVMKSLKRKLKAELSPDMIDIGECSLHKVHNAFSAGLDSFCSELESIVTDVHHYFKYATRHADMKELQCKLGLPQLEFLRHVNSRWLTLLLSIERVLKLYDALKTFFSKSGVPRTSSSARHSRLASAFTDSTLRAKLLFVQNAAQIFEKFQTLFQSKEPLLHIFYDEMVALVMQ
ncbi:hypothetical protein HPB47_017163, partial [Ixodes persulcatus]